MLNGMPRSALLLEFIVIFVALPLAYRFSPLRVPVLPLLWAVTVYAWWQLLRDPRFDRAMLWNAGALPSRLKWVLLVFAIVAFLIWLAVHRFAPELQWSFVRRSPLFW